ncbi:hypothetical protein N7495_002413 [Penicillium taxi]|uniref:uncharacterized protein n=1 Tax=Penicillium taxi TaxID=168475 RepID=UPI0025452D18|nr:uncharacterized protein N7495_002413 [Penicillium taxi]KAJ5901885.1 hypothetical protein N7495_002413 [Penicillium taxi]
MLTDVSSDELSQLNLFAQYAAAAYCSANIGSTGTALTCDEGICPEVEEASTTTLYEFDESSTYGDVTGFLAVDTTNELIVLSFRGSRDISNWVANLDFVFSSSTLCDDCEVHSGFWKAWETVADNLTSYIDSASETYPSYQLIFTGHSYGAALAALGATSLRNNGYTIDLYTYGQPRVGNTALATYMTDQGSLWRVTHSDDIVPRVPPEALGYTHASPEYWITSGTDVTVTASDITVLEGVGENNGNSGESELSILAHGWYFVYIDGCA